MSEHRDERALRYGRVEVGRPRTDRPGEHYGEVIPPPNHLTDEQLAAFERTGFDDIQPSGEQTPGQALNFAIMCFQESCELDGIGAPSAEAVRAEIRLRRSA